MSSIDIGAVDVDASSGSSWDGSDSDPELEVEVTHVVQQQKEEEEEGELDLELDESHKSSKTSPLPTKPTEGLPKGPSPRPAVQKTIANFFSDATVTVAQTQSTSPPPKNGRGKADEKAAARGGGSRCLPNSMLTTVLSEWVHAAGLWCNSTRRAAKGKLL